MHIYIYMYIYIYTYIQNILAKSLNPKEKKIWGFSAEGFVFRVSGAKMPVLGGGAPPPRHASHRHPCVGRREPSRPPCRGSLCLTTVRELESDRERV